MNIEPPRFPVICPHCKRKTRTRHQIKACRDCRSVKHVSPKPAKIWSEDHYLARELSITTRALKRLGGAVKWHAMSEDARQVLLNRTKRRKG